MRMRVVTSLVNFLFNQGLHDLLLHSVQLTSKHCLSDLDKG